MGDRDEEDMGWDSLFLLNQSEKLGASPAMASLRGFSATYPLRMENEHPFDRNEGISELVGSLVHPDSAQISNRGCPLIYERVSKEAAEAEGSYSRGKRSLPSDNKREIPGEKKPKLQDSDLHDKPGGKIAMQNSVGGEAPKETFIHVRARRGQATNSHSLAERVRREKISERMRLLQELVPGCHKITGKAVMLDELINYVQSLQQQVEFLSMKLATVYPDLNLDFEKNILQSRTGNEAIVRFGTEFTPSSRIQSGFTPSAQVEALRFCASVHSPIGDVVNGSDVDADGEIRSLLRVGFNRSSGFENV